MIVDVFEFLSRAARHSSVKDLFITIKDDQETDTEFLRQLLAAIVPLSQVTQTSVRLRETALAVTRCSRCQVADYEDDANIFLAEDDEDLAQGDLRPTGWDLVGVSQLAIHVSCSGSDASRSL